MQSRWAAFLLAVAVLVTGFAFADEPQQQVTINVTQTVVRKTKTGSVDWTKGVVRATGKGARPRRADLSEMQRDAMAERAAQVVAQRNLAETIKGVHLTSDTTVEMAEVQSDTIKTSLNAFLENSQVVSSKPIPGGWEVIMEASLYGLQGLSEVMLEETVRNEKALVESGKAPSPNVRVLHPDQAPVTVVVPQVVPEAPSDTGSTAVAPPPPASVPVATEQVSRVAQTGPFSGLIVDCRRLGVSPAMSPKIMAAGGREIWGTMMIDPEVAIERGIVAYYRTMEDARQSARAGENPLIVKAVGRAGRSRAYPSDAVVLDADGELILEENGKTKFLEKLNVCFVVDR